MAFGDLRVVERSRQANDDGVVRLAQRAGVAAGRAKDLGPLEEPLGREEADRELSLMARGAHGDRHRDRVLPRPGGADLERRLSDDPVVADLEAVAAHRDDPVARHVADGR